MSKKVIENFAGEIEIFCKKVIQKFLGPLTEIHNLTLVITQVRGVVKRYKIRLQSGCQIDQRIAAEELILTLTEFACIATYRQSCVSMSNIFSALNARFIMALDFQMSLCLENCTLV